MEYFTLYNGVRIPQIGYGVFQITQEDCERCVCDALKIGYRSIDTAQIYLNEAQVGSAIAKSGIPRKDIFLTTKVWSSNYGEEETRQSVFQSMEKLGTDYLDLVLLHQALGDVYASWRALEKLYDERKVRAIGISNFSAARCVEFANLNRISPMINQIELHPYHQQTTAISWMSKYKIQPQAWAPLGEGRGGLFTNPVLTSIGSKYGKTAAQIMLRWNIQRGIQVIPKSVHKERMAENLDIFDFTLDADDMAQVAALDKGKTSFIDGDDPVIMEQKTISLAAAKKF